MMDPVRFTFDDGGRSAAGFRGETGDCVVRAISIAGDLDYRWTYDALNEVAQCERPRKGRTRSSSRTGVKTATMQIGSGCQVHLRADELPEGRLVVNLSKHVAAVVDGTVHDIDPYVARDGTRCVYGYWTVPAGWSPEEADR